jgi:threonine dehydrogenase-like Zn-dependent dehydrogenase
MLCTWREVYGAFGDFALESGDDILIYGGGPVGLSFVKFARLHGLGDIYLVDRWPHKRAKGLSMGATAVFAPDEPALQTLLRERRGTFDAVIDAVGKDAIINSAFPLVKMGGSICVYGVIDTPSLHLDKSTAPYNFNLLIHQWPTRSRERAAQEPITAWIQSNQLSYREFVSAAFPISQIQESYEWSKESKAIKTLFYY